MAKGSEAKNVITQRILEMFPNSFVYDKEVRIPFIEDGEEIQIKCVLTCAKTNISAKNGSATEVDPFFLPLTEQAQLKRQKEASPAQNQITPEEKKEVQDLLSSFGF